MRQYGFSLRLSRYRSLLLKLRSILETRISSCRERTLGLWLSQAWKPERGHIQRTAQPCHRPDAPVPRDESEPHVTSLAK